MLFFQQKLKIKYQTDRHSPVVGECLYVRQISVVSKEAERKSGRGGGVKVEDPTASVVGVAVLIGDI
jgi:hypothetical protein